MHVCCHNAVLLPEYMWENVDGLHTFISPEKLRGYVKIKHQLCIVYLFIFFSNYWTNFKYVCLNLRQIRVIYFYPIPIKIYEIVISKIKMILCEHYHRFEIIQNTFFQTHLNYAVSKNTFKSLKRISGCHSFIVVFLL